MSATFQRQSLRVEVCPMVDRHILEILQIDKKSFKPHWSEEDFLPYLEQENCIRLVAIHAGHVVGYLVCEIHQTRLQIARLAVVPVFRHNGIGKQLIEHIILLLLAKCQTEIFVEVPHSNEVARKFWESQEFKDVCEEACDLSEDVHMMRYSLGNSPVNRISQY